MNNHRMPVCSILRHCIVISSLLCISEQCNPVHQGNNKIPAQRTALATAEQSGVEGRINFSLDLTPMPLARGAPICNEPAQPLTLVRARLGQTASLSCPLDHCLCHNATCQDLDAVLWRYNGCPVHHALCRGFPMPFVQSQTQMFSNAYLFIHNVAFETAGSVYCYCRRQNDTRGQCINQAYQLTPLLAPADVFEALVLNVTRPAGTNVTLLSKLRIRITQHTDHRYIVRYNRRIIWAPESHPLHALRETIFPSAADFALHADNFSMTIPYLPKSFIGQFEVWVRPYMEEDQFVVQTINLMLT